MASFRIALLRLSGAEETHKSAAFSHTLARAEGADMIVLDLFQAKSLSAAFVSALSKLQRPVRIVGASRHLKRLLKISQLDSKFAVIDRSMPLWPPSKYPGLHYAELTL